MGSRGPIGVGIASLAVLAASLLASFRRDFAGDLPTLLVTNGPRVLLAAGAGGLFGLAGALRLELERERPLRELHLLAVSAGAAAGGFALAEALPGLSGWLAFAAGAAATGAAFHHAVRALERPRRWTNTAAAGLIAAGVVLTALVGTYARARGDFVSQAASWLLGDLTRASFASGGALLALAVLGVAFAAQRLRGGGADSLAQLALLAFALGLGAVGPLVLVGSLAPRTVRALSRGASAAARVLASAAAGAASVAAIDAVPRLLVGGYDFPFNVAAGILAIPFFLGWNRARLRREAGAAGPLYEIGEVALITGMSLGAAAAAAVLARVIAIAT